MSRYSITRKLEIDAGHRLLGHEGKCRNVHGHRYVFEVTCSTTELDQVGRVVDFGVIKAKVGDWLDRVWDHGMLLQTGDPLIEWLRVNDAGGKVFTMKAPPTAENIARELFETAEALLEEDGVQVDRVRVHETPNCWATWEGSR